MFAFFPIYVFFLIFFQRFYLFLGQRETEHERGRGRKRGRHRIGNRLQAPSHQPRARRGARTHGLRDHDLSRSRPLNRLSHPGAPNVYLFLRQRETEHERGRGRKRGRHRMGNRLQALSHQPRARRGARTHGPRDRDLAEVRRSTDCATQASLKKNLKYDPNGRQIELVTLG